MVEIAALGSNTGLWLAGNGGLEKRQWNLLWAVGFRVCDLGSRGLYPNSGESHGKENGKIKWNLLYIGL